MSFPGPIPVVASLVFAMALGAAVVYRPEPLPNHGPVVGKEFIPAHGRPAHRVPECYQLTLQATPTKTRDVCVNRYTFDHIPFGEDYTPSEEDR